MRTAKSDGIARVVLLDCPHFAEFSQNFAPLQNYCVELCYFANLLGYLRNMLKNSGKGITNYLLTFSWHFLQSFY